MCKVHGLAPVLCLAVGWAWPHLIPSECLAQVVCADLDRDGVCDTPAALRLEIDRQTVTFPLNLVFRFAVNNTGETDLGNVRACDAELVSDALAAGLAVGPCALCTGPCDAVDDTCAQLGLIDQGAGGVVTCTVTAPSGSAWRQFAALDGVPDDCYDNQASVSGEAVVGPGVCGPEVTVNSACGASACLDTCACELSVTKEACIEPPSPGGGEGCTPGYWKNHTGAWPAAYAPGDDFDSVFGVSAFKPDRTLLAALENGGGGVDALGRHAVAGLLNAASDGVNYALSVAEVIALVQSALAPGGDVEAAKNTLESHNEAGCPLDGNQPRRAASDGRTDEGVAGAAGPPPLAAPLVEACAEAIRCGVPTRVLFRYTVTNDSDCPMTDVSVVDDVFGPVPGSPIGEIAPHSSAVLTLIATLSEETTNVVTVTGNVTGDSCQATAELTVPDDCTDGGGQGCTPGYWKQEQHFDSWVGYQPGQSFGQVFGVPADAGFTLLDALRQGGGGASALGRHATAGLLNAASPGVDYRYSVAEVIALVQAAYASGDYESAKNLLEAENELGCPLN